jgi:hypothetical protein
VVETSDNPFAPHERDLDDPKFIQFKKKVLKTVLSLVKEEA